MEMQEDSSDSKEISHRLDKTTLTEASPQSELEKLIEQHFLSVPEVESFSHHVRETVQQLQDELQGRLQNQYPNRDNNIFKLIPFGSFRYGIWPRDEKHPSDVDLILLGSAFTTEEFFLDESLYHILFEPLETSKFISNIRKITDATIPLFQLQMKDNLKIDLLYAKLPAEVMSQIKDVDETRATSMILHLEDSLVRSLDNKSLQSINGLRDTAYLLECFPTKEKMNQFVSLVQICKLWAKARGLYSPKFGFLGGFAWSILCAHLILNKSTPSDDLASLLYKFFDTWSSWEWKNYVHITAKHNYRSQNPKKDLVVILTCTAPFKNIIRHISRSTLSIIKEEFLRGKELMKIQSISQIFERKQFEQLYNSYLQVTISAVTEELFTYLTAWFESRIMALVYKLESLTKAILIHPFNVPTLDSNNNNYPFSYWYYLGVKKLPLNEKSTDGKIDMANAIYDFIQQFDREGKLGGMDMKIKQVPRSSVCIHSQ